MTNWYYFSYFSQKTGFDILCKLSPAFWNIFLKKMGFWHCMQTVSSEDNLHEMSVYFQGKVRKIFQNVTCWKCYQACKVLNTPSLRRILCIEKVSSSLYICAYETVGTWNSTMLCCSQATGVWELSSFCTWSIHVADWLGVPTLDHRVLGLDPTRGRVQLLNGTLLHRTFHYHSFIISVWLNP